MSLRHAVALAVSLAALWTPAVLGQSATAGTSSKVPEGGVPTYVKPETPEQRLERIATQEDPGLDPDPEKVFIRFGKPYTIHRFERRYSKEVRPGWVRPIAGINFAKEVYQQNDKYVWVWNPETERGAAKREKVETLRQAAAAQSDESIAYFEYLRGEFTPLAPPAANVTVRFEEASAGLPTSGSWRNGAAVADMNEDGHADIIAPPQRGPANFPSIFLGDGKGGWKRWAQAKWDSSKSGFDYGTAAVADFNKDKHLDVAFAVHLTGVTVFLGDGKGNFRRADKGMGRDFPTRRVTTTDVDGDGWTDIVAISEGPMGRPGAGTKKEATGNLIAYLNRGKGESWEAMNIAQPGEFVGGDWLATGNFNGDRYPDFFGATVYFNSTQTVYMSGAEPKTYRLFNDESGKLLPARSYYHATTTGRFASKKFDDAIVGFYRSWPENLDAKLVPPPPLTRVIGFDRLSFEGGEVKRTPIVRWGGTRSVWALDRGDFDGDGNLDVAYTTFEPQRELVILLGDGAGNFKRASVEGVSLAGLKNYDLKVADFNADTRPDVLVMYEAQETTGFGAKNGRMQVFLNRGAGVASAAK